MNAVIKSLKVNRVTRTWQPSLAFKLRTSADTRRRLAAFHRFQKYRDRIGQPIEYSADPLAAAEIRFLNAKIKALEQEIPDYDHDDLCSAVRKCAKALVAVAAVIGMD